MPRYGKLLRFFNAKLTNLTYLCGVQESVPLKSMAAYTLYIILRAREGMSILSDLKQLLLPRLCPVCGQLMMEGEDVLCAYCAIRLPRFRIMNTADNLLTRELWDTVPVGHAYTYMTYNRHSPYKNLVHCIKYRGHFNCAIRLGQWAAAAGQNAGIFAHADALVPVPLTRLKRIRRGYNQAEMLARGMSEVTGLPVVNLLRRTREGSSQTHLSRTERRANVQNIYRAHIPDAWRGKRLLLVDDVMTTGATLANCALALLAADKSAEVSVFPFSTNR